MYLLKAVLDDHAHMICETQRHERHSCCNSFFPRLILGIWNVFWGPDHLGCVCLNKIFEEKLEKFKCMGVFIFSL